jgi:hypothetical protein
MNAPRDWREMQGTEPLLSRATGAAQMLPGMSPRDWLKLNQKPEPLKFVRPARRKCSHG